MRILIVDDHALFRHGLKFVLRDLDAELRIDEAADCKQALAQAGEEFDLLLLDLRLPGVSGLEALEKLRDTFDATRIVVLSGEEDPRQVRAAIDAGAAGFIPKASTPEVLLSALRLILSDGVYLPPVALRDGVIVGAMAGMQPTEPLDDVLSPRQLDVLHKAVQGKSNKVIARELSISEATVKTHLSAAFRALGVHNRTEAVYAAARSGLHLRV